MTFYEFIKQEYEREIVLIEAYRHLNLCHGNIEMHLQEKIKIAEDFMIVDTIVEHLAASNHVRIYGRDRDAGEYVVIIPSIGRGVEDYTEKYKSTMTTRLVEAGYRIVLIQPRGIGKSTGDITPENTSMNMFAQDIKACLDALHIKKAHLIGHAFGNRLARTFATLYPSYIENVVLMAAGGNFKLNKVQKFSLFCCFNSALDDQERLKAIKRTFFADGNDPSVWLNGWHLDLAKAQTLSAWMINHEYFKKAGEKPILLIQGKEDFIAPPEKAGQVLKAELKDQITYVEIPHAGHALSPERPDEIAAHIVTFFKTKQSAKNRSAQKIQHSLIFVQ